MLSCSLGLPCPCCFCRSCFVLSCQNPADCASLGTIWWGITSFAYLQAQDHLMLPSMQSQAGLPVGLLRSTTLSETAAKANRIYVYFAMHFKSLKKLETQICFSQHMCLAIADLTRRLRHNCPGTAAGGWTGGGIECFL